MPTRRLVYLLLLLATAAGPASRPASVPTHQPEVPTAQHPVTATIWIDPVEGDADVSVHILLRIAPGHWLYATTKSNSPFTPVKLTWEPDPAIREVGAMIAPTPDAQSHYTGDIDFLQHLRLAHGATGGKHVISCNLTFQACNSDLCWPPQTIELKVDLDRSARPRQ